MLHNYENLNNDTFYFKNCTSSDQVILTELINLCNLYKLQFTKNINKEKITVNKYNTLFIKGFEVLCHIFKIFILYTNNLNCSKYHCEKSIYYYLEFTSQRIEENHFIPLTLTDSVIFVYKKTIYLLEKNYAHINSNTNINTNLTIICNILLNYINKPNYEAVTQSILDDFTKENLDKILLKIL